MKNAVDRYAEEPLHLWLLAASPSIWMLHFMVTYITGALWCGMVAGRDGPLAGAHLAIAAYTVVALIAIGIVGWSGHTRHGATVGVREHSRDDPQSRTRFLGLAAVLLSGLSALATIYVAISAAYLPTC